VYHYYVSYNHAVEALKSGDGFMQDESQNDDAGK
jgi:hypothetical protein